MFRTLIAAMLLMASSACSRSFSITAVSTDRQYDAATRPNPFPSQPPSTATATSTPPRLPTASQTPQSSTPTPLPSLKDLQEISIETASRITPLRVFDIRANQIIWAPDGKSLIVADESGPQLLKLPSFTRSRSFQIDDVQSFVQSIPFVDQMALSQNGERLAAIFQGGLQQWDYESGRPVWAGPVTSYTGFGYPNPTCLAFNRAATRLAVCFANQLFLLDADYNILLRLGSEPLDFDAFNRSVIFDPSGAHMLTVGDYNGVLIWSTVSGSIVGTLDTGTPSAHVEYTKDGSKLIILTPYTLQVWDPKTRTLSNETNLNLDKMNFTTALAVSPSGDVAAAGTEHGDIILIDVPDGTVIAGFPAHHGQVHGLDFSPNGDLLASSGYETDYPPIDAESQYLTYEETELRIWGVHGPP